MRLATRICAIVAGMLAGSGTASAALLLDFEGLPDGTAVTTQYPGVTFSNATILTAGIGLNEFEFPPGSGTNVLADLPGPMSLFFMQPVVRFSAYLTYSSPVELQGVDAGGNVVARASSAFSNNTALSGDPDSSPNELFQIEATSGMLQIAISGSPGGGSFAMDDATIVATAVPEPSQFVPLGAFLMLVAASRRRGQRGCR